jgi:tetratricopeptide (TPR) repeat protein
MLNRVQKLADSGRDAAVVAELGALPVHELGQSPTLGLLFGIAQARLGRSSSGKQWVATALETAQARGDSTVAARALNVSGAIAFEEGQVDEAVGYFTRGLAEAERLGDRATVGRCSNNLGIIANLRGLYGRAIGSYTMALAAFQQAARRAGVAETLHNLAITYRDQRNLAKATETEERAADEANAAGDLSLVGLIHCGRAKIRLRAGDADLARVEVNRALATHREVGDVVGEAEDLRTLAGALELLGQPAQAEFMLRDVIGRAERLNRPLLAARAERDLARLLLRRKQTPGAARDLALRARSRFNGLGAVVEVRRLDGLLSEIPA